MKSWILLINLLWLTSCVEQVKERVRGFLGSPTVTEEAETTYKPQPPPNVEEDKTIQLSPKERALSLFEQFNRSPDETLAGLTLAEFTTNRALFGATADPALKTELNRSITNIQNGNRLTMRLLSQLMPIFLGENKEQLKNILARGFDSAPAVLADVMGRSGEDKLCSLAGLIPPEVTAESKRDFLEDRIVPLAALRADTTVSAFARPYIETCIRTLQIAMNITDAEMPKPAQQVDINGDLIAPESLTADPEPTAVPVTEPPQTPAPVAPTPAVPSP